MPEYQENSIIDTIDRLAENFYRLSLRAPLIASAARPGQFVMVSCAPFLDPLLRRPFSIHRCNGSDTLQLLIRVVGRGTELLARCRPGQSLSLIGPLGRGFNPPPPASSVCLVGGGIGIAPLLFWAERLKTPRRCTVLLGSRTGKELTQLAAEFSQLGCRVETATDDGSLGHRGLVTDLLAAHLPTAAKTYACGPMPMMAAVAQTCRDAKVACEVSLEAHMACGLGACLGCTVHGDGGRYLHVCKNGPVVNAEEVAWQR
ncbi:MAG: dihydroorotate dehydrogenase electron transfer subunit [Desulfobulbus sp.]|jgi:dihydroorotate dehydrogenase electron transfer subunit|uniref:dihydroorotate dehydrogenase electron transfer subunit n=1 Tax=Desulfobulbus sp. TaxID=895 RepID=UPI0028426CB6|nr:dihydroorotate dehydrogenase electron transfer subunit [Desulfobulbus sp.]MDR2549488.1 dihydroorotate dehydrogenase electron transfer subunit [Desulfobulbus sp.]